MTSVRCIDPCLTPRARPFGRAHYGARSAAVVVAIAATVLASAGSASADTIANPVPMGTAEPFAVLAGTGITNTGITTISGDIGSLPNAVMTVTGSILLTGTNHQGDGVTASAKGALTTAYDAAETGQPAGARVISADLAGQLLPAGVYTSGSSLAINGTAPLRLDANNDPNAVFVFQAVSTLITQPYTKVQLIRGAKACNVFWQVGSDTTLGVNSVFVGNILTKGSSTLDTGATLEGSVLSRNGAVTMDSNTIKRPACATPPSGGTWMITNSGTTPFVPPPVTPPVTPTGPTTGNGPANGSGGQVTRIPVGAVAAGGGGSAAVGRLWPSLTR
ncbi:MAG: autotransporter [Blastococcus sp.]|jgi:hypothetical protein|nr:autotransporter [Blastococcus sp.]